MGDKFVFLSGCEHLFCLECLGDDVTMKINEGKLALIRCADGGCLKPFNDLDIRKLGLDQSLIDKYEEFSVHNAIAQMDDMGWCPMCDSLANYDKAENSGKCQHCEFYFCLDCKNRFHPFKRCDLNRVDLIMQTNNDPKFLETQEGNAKAADALMNLFMKHCMKTCPNQKCGAKI